MVTICSLAFFLLSACLVTARPGAEDRTAMMCSMRVNRCGSDFMSADFTTPEGLAAICSTFHPRLISCINEARPDCPDQVNTGEIGTLILQLDSMCAGGCSMSTLTPCLEIVHEVEEGASMCSIKDRFLQCDRGLPSACADDDMYILGVAPIRSMLENTSC